MRRSTTITDRKNPRGSEYVGSIFLDKEELTLFFDAVQSGMDFLYAITEEGTGIKDDDVRLTTEMVARCVTRMLPNARETYGEAEPLDATHPCIRAACKAANDVVNEFREEQESATPKAKVTERPFAPLLVPQQPDAPVALKAETRKSSGSPCWARSDDGQGDASASRTHR